MDNRFNLGSSLAFLTTPGRRLGGLRLGSKSFAKLRVSVLRGLFSLRYFAPLRLNIGLQLFKFALELGESVFLLFEVFNVIHSVLAFRLSDCGSILENRLNRCKTKSDLSKQKRPQC